MLDLTPYRASISLKNTCSIKVSELHAWATKAHQKLPQHLPELVGCTAQDD